MTREIIASMTVKKFKEILPRICGKNTSFDPKGWTKDNPFWGHCAVVSLLAQDLFGGELLRSSLSGTKFSRMRFHFWNFFTDKHWDFTRPQFGGQYPTDLVVVQVKRSLILSLRETAHRYELLKRNWEQEIE